MSLNPGAGAPLPQQSSPYERASAFVERTTRLIADQFQAVPGGAAVLTPSLPAVWWLNQLRVTEPLSTEEVLSLADEALAELPYRQLYVVNERTGRELEHALRPPDWSSERDVIMALERDPDRIVDTASVTEVGEEPMLELMGRWHMEGPAAGRTPSALAQLLEHTRREGRALGDRNFAVKGARGEPLAMTKLRSDGVIAQIEDVYTTPEARGRGYARALVTRAVAEARAMDHELVFIVADDNDWPRRLYRRLGFEPVGYAWAFHRDLRRAPSAGTDS